MKHIKQLSCMVLAGLLMCGVLAAALPQEEEPIPQPSVPELTLEPEKEQLYTMKVADQVQLKIAEDSEPEQPEDGQEPGSGMPEEIPGSEPDSEEEVPGSEPASPEETDAVWNSDDESVVTVDENGLVTAVGEGTTKVYQKVSQGAVWVEITVSGYAVTEL